MLVILLALSLLVIVLSRAVPSWKTEIQREREAREIDHARQYRMAIRRYYHAYGRYPPSLDAMVEQDGKGQRYLRQEFADPLNLKDGGKFQLVHYGQAVTAEIVDQPPAAAQSKTQVGSMAGPQLAGGAAASPSMGASSTTASNGLSQGVPSAFGTPSGSAGGGPIIGVASANKQLAVHAFNGFDTPDHWQFVYNFAEDPSLRAGAVGVQPGVKLPLLTTPQPGGVGH